jgi:hypothetical protein
MSQELTAAATAAAQTWYLFWAAPEFRPYCLEANEKMLDAALTRYGLSLTVNNLRCVFPEVEPQLARIAPRVQPEAVPTVEPVASVELAPDQLPLEITRKHILDMPKAEFYALQKQYGTAAIENRANGLN